MAINIGVQYNGGLLPDIILLTQGYYDPRGTRFNTMEWLRLYSLCNSILLLPCLMIDVLLHCFCFCCFSGVPAWRLM